MHGDRTYKMGETPLLILYGSQTGNSREVSKELCEKAVAKGYAARVVSMADFKTLDFEAERRVVVVCSSTGNGDAPDNADRFYRYVKRKTTPAILAKSHFAVCAMGDQNYELFCEVGKQFDQHFERLGGTRFLKRCDVDEVEGIEETVHKWYEALWPALAAVPAADGADVEMAEAAAPPPTVEPTPATAPAVAAAPAAADDDEEAVGSCAAKPVLVPIVAARWLTASAADDDAAADAAVGTDGPAAVRAAGVRRVLHLELDVSGAPGGGAPGTALHHEPGDAISVVCHNDGAEVAALLDALGVADADAPLPPPPTGADVPTHLRGDGLSAREALSTRVDVGSTTTWPPLPLLRLLLAVPDRDGANAPARAALREILIAATAAGGGPAARDAQAKLQREKPSLLSLLRRLGGRVPLAALLDALPPLAPRQYSVCNSALATPGRIHLCLSVVRYATRDASNTPSLRWGLASSMLAKLAAPLLAPGGGGGAVPMVKVFKNPPSGNELRLPTTPATPVVMIGPGTGVAPFRAFVQERKVRATPPRVHLYALPKPPPDPLTLHSSRPPPQVRWPRSQLGPTHLYFGCQRAEVDFLYADELQTMSLSGALQLHTAFSRAGDPAEAGWWRGVRVGVTYVQDVLEERKAEVAGLLYDANAHLYVCGDGKAMATDVHGALLRITADHFGVPPAEAEARLAKLAAEGRYTREIWN